MRTLTTPAHAPAATPAPAPARRTLTRISALGVACSAALALAACGGGGSAHKGSSGSTSAAGSFPGAPATSSSPSPQPSFDPAAGPIMNPAQLPKNCTGLVTDADMQLALGNPLNGGDYFQPFQPTAAKQLGRVVCQYGVVQDPSGKITSNQVEIQLAIYADAATAQSHGATTVGTFAGQGDQYAPISVAGHPATYVIEAGKDAVLVMYDGNRTYLITTAESLVKGDEAKVFTLKIAQALYKHTTPAAPTTPSSSAATPGAPSSSGASTPGAPSSPPAAGSTAPAGTPAPGGSAPPSSPSSPPAD
ncbi:hypothetical protein Caci_5669 [Catenulispora acidiphila DSM 44928]|uniref:DUF3558 domain-containing protein n=1 Tax=Catenulispora acidiphila (strain DSM 44928 / JCM 14897 / NBRC 102108 / NRRL B-24433 / ID139908) TaxID=479433 RepID=C7QC80_CATAD|nr:hypothetical protein [Catenulispora acidiphila]ACU74528.1 hypothetical protein Caci_5669 [Catenulispora acidiphila DSM 44928]